jgi:hypothetical protein
MTTVQPSDAVRFRATSLLAGTTATGIEVPADAVAVLGSSRRPAVRATIAGYSYRSTVASMRGTFMLPIRAAIHASASVAAADEVDVELVLDTEPRVVTMAPDLAAALDADAEAKRFFDRLAYSQRLRWVLSVEGAKTEETGRRRIAKAVEALREGRR